MMMGRNVVSKDMFQSQGKGTGLGKGNRTTVLCCNRRERGQEGVDVGGFLCLQGGR